MRSRKNLWEDLGLDESILRGDLFRVKSRVESLLCFDTRSVNIISINVHISLNSEMYFIHCISSNSEIESALAGLDRQADL